MALSYPETHELTREIIGCAIEVHRTLGPGLLESIYEECLFNELRDHHLEVFRQPAIPLRYKSHTRIGVYRPDLVVNGSVIVEVKAVEKILPVHEAQLLTYLKLMNMHVGLLLNFHSVQLTSGLSRMVN
jgi:GxxExxY protein